MTYFTTSSAIRQLCGATAIAAVLALPSAALAQTDAESDEAATAEIVVTAQLREQSLQTVPIALQVITADQIDAHAADSIADIAAFIPGLAVSADSPTQPRYAIRGISTSDFGVGTDPAVGVYIDGVYSGRSGAAVLEFNDIERIEVLKGPQGTLFGRNAAAGAVAVVTRKPSERFEASLSGRMGNFGKLRGEALLNLPLGDTLALRVNGVYNHRNGLYTDAATGQRLNRQENWAARAQLRWSPGADTEVIAGWTHHDLDQDARPAFGIVALPAYPATPAPAPAPSAYLDPLTAPLRNDVVNNREFRNLDEFTLRVSHRFGAVKFDSITSYREFRTGNREDEDGTNRIDLYFDTNNVERNRSIYQELRLSQAGSTIDWVAGVSFFDENADQSSETFTYTDTVNTALGNIGFGTPFSDLEYGLLVPLGVPATMLGHGWRETMTNRGDYQAYAAFGDVIWHVSDRLNLTAGLRYTRDDKRFSWRNGLREAPELDATLAALEAMGLLALAGTSPEDFMFDLVFDLTPFGGIACAGGALVSEGQTCVLKDSFSDISPRAVIDYRLSDKVMAYASYAQGYKAGGFNSVQPASRFANEDVDNFELGIKSRFPALGLTLNASAFHYVYNNRQAIRLTVTPASPIPQYVTQTSDEQAWGADLAVEFAPGRGPLTLFANAQYIDATYQRRIDDQGQDLAGQPTGAPTWSLALGARVQGEIGGLGRLSFEAMHAYQSKCRSNAESLAEGTCGGTISAFRLGTARNRTDLRAGWTSPDGRFAAGLYVNNLFDNRYVEGVRNITASTLGTPFAAVSPPRTWGGDLRISF